MLTGLRRRVQLVRDSADAGVSLPELLMAMLLSTLLGAVTMVLFVSVDNATSTNTDRSINAAKARNVVQAWTSYLQVSDSATTGSALNRFEWFAPTNVLFYADLYNRPQTATATTNPPSLMWLRLDSAGQFVEEQFATIPTSFPAKWSTCRLLGGGASATKLFTPYGSTGNDLSSLSLGAAQNPGTGCQKLPSTLPSQLSHPDQVAAANLEKLFSVGIDFTVKDTKKSHPLEFNAVVTLPFLVGAT
ncbi:MAG TPA: hypothetical protein VGN35_05380 [Jatrophihabitantaceae bacterium]|jgi:hypothetical protein|nr:hypothetical protein [Jatrophihabitantaceae bacterium]